MKRPEFDMDGEAEDMPFDEVQWEQDVARVRIEADKLAEKLYQAVPIEGQQNPAAVKNLARLIAVSKLGDIYGEVIIGDVYYISNATKIGQFVEGYLKEVYPSEIQMGGDYLGLALGPEKSSPFMYIKSKTALGKTLLASPLQSKLLPVTVNVLLNKPCLQVEDGLLQMSPPVNKDLA